MRRFITVGVLVVVLAVVVGYWSLRKTAVTEPERLRFVSLA